MIRYLSTRGQGGFLSFEEVLLQGLAPDGGLYVPEVLPRLDLAALAGQSYPAQAMAVMYPFVEGFMPRADFARILEETYGPDLFRHTDVTPLQSLGTYGGGGLFVMEQFHGPTLAFKDVALQLLGRLFDYVLCKTDTRMTIVGATSGDTGSAAIEGCRRSGRISIFILHPRGRVSDVQRKQMTTVIAPNVHNIALAGSFDDCQNMVKAMFRDEAFRSSVRLSAVNSINWARIMAQIVYYVRSSLDLRARGFERVSFVVPTGNFGNVLAAYYAKAMGAPIHRLCVASNRNDILTRFFETGEMKMAGNIPSLSPSMDIEISSNFERYLFELLGRDSVTLADVMARFSDEKRFAIAPETMAQARADFQAARADDTRTLEVIRGCFHEAGYTLDPHTAVGVSAALGLKPEASEARVVLGTAHPAKFPDAVRQATGLKPALPPHLVDLFEKPEAMVDLPNDRAVVQGYVLEKQ